MDNPALDTAEEQEAWKENRCGQHTHCMEVPTGCDCTCRVCCRRRASLAEATWR